MSRTTDITSYTEHRRKLRDHIHQVRETGRPLYITTNGQTDAVVLSPEAYDKLADKAELADSLSLLVDSETDVEKRRTRKPKAALKKLAAELGIKIDR